MEITENVALSNYSTMRLGGIARYLVEVRNRNELKEAHQWAMKHELPIIMVGTGSNIVWRDEGFAGLVMVNRITGYDDYNEDARSHYITVGAGEIWDSVVARSVASGLTGIEALSLVPGTAGATPVQNVGAYGQEISQTLTSIEAYDATTGQLVNIPAEACGFGYRTSKFQTEYRNRFFITAITLHLMAGNPYPPFYSAIDQYFQQHPPLGTITPRVIRDAVIAIRQAKLPDPDVIANTGSFFANPIVDDGTLTDLRTDNPTMPYWPLDGGGAKIPAAWLIEQVGFKDVHDGETGMATWATQPLVLVNESATTTAQLLTFRNKIISAVQEKYNITLRQEPELLPTK
jgi:UDP-N-acetylmuramate dehydrogenase